jgi:hypothetical protein
MIRRLLVALLVCAAFPGGVGAHPPGTAIGRAVTGLQQGPVTYDSGAAIGEQEADGLLRVVCPDPRVRVALMPAEALTELPAGGGSAAAVAAEVAREADVGGTIVVLAGRRLGVWSEDISPERTGVLVQEAEQAYPAGPLSLRVTELVGRLRAEPVDAGTPWGVIAAVVSIVAIAALAGLHVGLRRRSTSTS